MLLKDKLLLGDNVLLGSCKEAKQMLKMLGVEHISYQAYTDDYILCIVEYEDRKVCLECGHDRYKKSKSKGKAHGPPHKVLRNLPIILRIQRFFHYK